MENIIRQQLEKQQFMCIICDKSFINARALNMHNYKKHKENKMNEIREEQFNRVNQEDLNCFPSSMIEKMNREIVNTPRIVIQPELISLGLFTLENNKIKKIDTDNEIVLKFDKNSKLLKSLNDISDMIKLKPILIQAVKTLEELELIKGEIEAISKSLEK